MAQHNETGILGEKIAHNFLIKKGYQVVATNWRWGKGEIDLIGRHQGTLIFVEVKTRTNATFGQPEEAISVKKQQLMYELASEYMFREQYEEEYRFDIISIVLRPSREINHYEDAFFPHW